MAGFFLDGGTTIFQNSALPVSLHPPTESLSKLRTFEHNFFYTSPIPNPSIDLNSSRYEFPLILCVTPVGDKQNISFLVETMLTIQHPGHTPLIDIVGIYALGNGRSCEEHKCCGCLVIAIDVVLRLHSVQVRVNNVLYA
jgi:hypothetical protein